MPSAVQTWLEHIRVLAEDIGPRGSTTEGERRGSEYCQATLSRLGLDARIEAFSGSRSAYAPAVLTSLVILAAFAIYPLGGRTSAIVAALLSLLVMISQILDLGFQDNPLRWVLPKGPSQNVVATLPPGGEHHQDLVLIGHVDTNRTPLLFSTFGWVDFFRIFVTFAFFAYCGQVILYGIGAATGWGWIWTLTGVSALCAVAMATLFIQADLTPFTAGANDNATAVGLVLTLAERLQSETLRHTRVWLVCTGCEEVKHHGAIDFFRRHRAELLNPRTLVFEMLGRDGPAWLLREGIVVPFTYYADREMVTLAGRISAEHPEWQAHPVRVGVGHTEMADARRLGIPAITLIGIGPEGAPFGYRGKKYYWHQKEDTFDKIKPEVLERAYAFTWAFIQALDTRSEPESGTK